ncbi:MAG: folate-binding protein YgfZ [Rhodocyclaceae bacterium]|nr:folate-binding protein YgfZ [Rhodocyclaceae bacterium]
MSGDWKNFIAAQGLVDDGRSFGDGPAELAAARDGTVVVPVLDDGLILAAGEDAVPFLHNLLTNDVTHLGADEVRFAGLCTAKGRLIASFEMWRDPRGVMLLAAADILDPIQKKLSMYVLRSKVRLSRATEDTVLIGLAGPEAGSALARLGAAVPAARSTAAFPGGIAARLDERRILLAVAAPEAQQVWSALAAQARPAGTAAWRWLEILAGRPRVVAETQEAFVPQMVNMEIPEVGGVSFKKGCYPGQEIVARTQYLGKVKRRMFRGRLAENLPAGTDLFTPEAGDQHCGALVSVAPSPDGGYDTLFVVQSSGAEAGEVHAGSPAGPRIDLLPLPYALPA